MMTWFFEGVYRASALLFLLTTTHCRERANYRFTTCDNRDREGPTHMECTDYYCNYGSSLCDHIFITVNLRGSQFFTIPRSGNYTVTIAGASGGHGVCSNYSGLGVIARETVYFRRGEILRILVGQQGTSACDGHQDVEICQISNDTEACDNLWTTVYRNMEFGLYYFFDGGGGGGGASLLHVVGDDITTYSNLQGVIAPGGGGAGALYDVTTFLRLLNITYNDSNALETLYQNYTNAHAFETFSESADGKRGAQFNINSAGAGAGFMSTLLLDAAALIVTGFGGIDCNEGTIRPTLFPDTHGGFGGGGGGCDGGGGGGGYTGGSIIAKGAALAGEGGYSWPDPPWPLMGYNDGDGYVELFLESCGCTYNCIIDDQSSFECSCPSDTILARNGFDCYTEENYYFETESEGNNFSHPTYGTIVADIIQLNNTVFAYSVAVVFSNDSSSEYCAVLFTNQFGYLIATTKFINRSDETQYLKLFLADTTFDQSVSLSVSLSTNSELMLEEPLFIASVLTFGISGDCILVEMVINASIDDIYEINDTSQQIERIRLSDDDVLSVYLDSFDSMFITTTVTTDDDTSLSAGAIAGIVIAIILVITIVMVILVIGVCCHHHQKQSISLKTCDGGKIDDGMSEKQVTINDCHYYDDKVEKDVTNHEYEQLTHGYENIQKNELTDLLAARPRTDTLKYGLSSPLHDYYQFNCLRKNKEDWSYDRDQLSYMREIGEGQFGKVLLMKAKDICGVQGSVLVAVKTLTSRDPKDIQRFSDEMGLMMKFIHPNIVSLLGHCEATSDGAPMMILELMQYGDLKWFLQSNRPSEGENSVITDKVALSIVIDVASALEYLADNHFVHRDVAARNCLLGEGFKAKLSDFGLARGVHERDYYKVTGKSLLPVKWLAPESLLYGKFTSASDVWSFGVLVWEVATYGERPHDDVQTRNIIEMASNGTLMLNSPVGCPEILASVISQCYRIPSEERPTFTEILEFCSKKNLSITVEQSSTAMEQSFI